MSNSLPSIHIPMLPKSHLNEQIILGPFPSSFNKQDKMMANLWETLC